jgi:nucleotide-binding universal stress UspA family protein
MIAIKNILCPTDFSSYSDHALSYAMEFAGRFGATVHVHHALNVPYMAMAYEIGPDVVAAREIAEKTAKEGLAEKARLLSEAGVAVETHLTVGTPFVDVVTLAREKSIDLIIIATHGRSALKQVFMGSTAERVVRKAPCPVLSVKDPEQEFVHP